MQPRFDGVCFAVTGAAGFLGSNVCNYLLEHGAWVLALDNFLTGQVRNIGDIRERYPHQFFFAEEDIVNGIQQWDFFIAKNKIPHPKFLFHLASPASPIDFEVLWRQTAMANTVGLLKCFDWAEKFETRVIFASTSEVYGNPAAHPQMEDHLGEVNFHGPRGCYDEAKRLGEALVYQMVNKGAPHGVVRIFNTYGPGMRLNDGRVMSSFFQQVYQRNRIVVHGDGAQTRSFCYARDMVKALLAYAYSLEQEPVNLGSMEELSILQLAEIIAKRYGNWSTRIEFAERRRDDPQRRRPELSRAREILNWTPTTTLLEGLDLTAKYFYDGLKLEGARMLHA